MTNIPRTKEIFIEDFPSNHPDVEEWEITGERHFVLDTENVCIPLPTLYSVKGVTEDGATLPFKSYSLKTIHKHIDQAEEYFTKDMFIFYDQDLREPLDRVYGELW